MQASCRAHDRSVSVPSPSVPSSARSIGNSHRTPQRRIVWECVLEGADATVTTDASRCQQIFGNLVANALKYTPESGQVKVIGRQMGEQWHISVSDSGPGIPSDALAKVFEPFFRLSRDEHSGVEGSGLGLAICREMVDQMDGEIAISSTVGQGTRVTVILPVDGSSRSS